MLPSFSCRSRKNNKSRFNSKNVYNNYYFMYAQLLVVNKLSDRNIFSCIWSSFLFTTLYIELLPALPMGVKFGMEEGTEGSLLHAKFHPVGATIRV